MAIRKIVAQTCAANCLPYPIALEPFALEPIAMERTDPLYIDALRFLMDRINFEKAVEVPYDQQSYRLARMAFLLEHLGNPQLAAPVIHIAGTKGKGSVAWLLAETLRRSGLRTGLYTSPHLEHLEERFVVNGAPVPPEYLVRTIPRLAHAVQQCVQSEHGDPTFFELTTALAWCLFQTANTQVNVIEVGLGGRLDSTNICQPCLAIITSISFDHQQQLGNTLAGIAREKAGIIKPGVPVIHGARAPSARDVIRQVAEQQGCSLWELGTDFEGSVQPRLQSEPSGPPHQPSSLGLISTSPFDFHARHRLPNIELPPMRLRMLGNHQADNAALAVAAWLRLSSEGWDLPRAALADSLAETQVPGRIEIVANHPCMIIDAAHNEASIEALIHALKSSFAPDTKTIIFACSKDKKYPEMLRALLRYADRLIVTQYHSNPRFVPVERLEQLAHSLQANTLKDSSGRPVKIYSAPDLPTAIDFARRTTESNDLLCITGSFFTAAEAKRYLQPNGSSS